MSGRAFEGGAHRSQIEQSAHSGHRRRREGCLLTGLTKKKAGPPGLRKQRAPAERPRKPPIRAGPSTHSDRRHAPTAHLGPEPQRMLLAASFVSAGETCSSGIAGDAARRGCAEWCKAEKAPNHCRFCKCAGCAFCSGVATTVGGDGASAGKRKAQGAFRHSALPWPHRRSSRATSASCSARVGTVPFVMWMPGRTGSTWVQEALNSHPEVTMLGEVFNNGTSHDGFTQAMCRFYGAPAGRRVRRARGFKQKFFQCNADLKEKLCEYERQPWAQRALESCLRPASTPPPPGMAPDAGWNVTTRSFSVFTAVGARVICSLRRSSLDRALSKAVQVSFFKKCGVSNAVTAAERACLERMKAEGVRVSVEYVLDVMRQAEMAAAYNAAICEAQARVSPVFYLWYEDLLAQPDRVFEELQRFIGVEPRPLRSTAQRIVSKGAASWISNLDEVRAAATALRGGKAALEDGRCKKS